VGMRPTLVCAVLASADDKKRSSRKAALNICSLFAKSGNWLTPLKPQIFSGNGCERHWKERDHVLEERRDDLGLNRIICLASCVVRLQSFVITERDITVGCSKYFDVQPPF
jgi:hypothetical protein